MSQFFGHDFTEERWRKAALKNAYALLGKQRFDHAAAFFLLGDTLWDAVQVSYAPFSCSILLCKSYDVYLQICCCIIAR